jgi:hypothetical protein
MILLCLPGINPHVRIDYTRYEMKNPPGSMAWGGLSLTRRRLLRFAHPHTLAGLEQQQRHMQVVLGIIVIANVLYRG